MVFFGICIGPSEMVIVVGANGITATINRSVLADDINIRRNCISSIVRRTDNNNGKWTIDWNSMRDRWSRHGKINKNQRKTRKIKFSSVFLIFISFFLFSTKIINICNTDRKTIAVTALSTKICRAFLV